nr:hypothetical protein Hi04_10k_c4335_00008 [uncultured bacterium]
MQQTVEITLLEPQRYIQGRRLNGLESPSGDTCVVNVMSPRGQTCKNRLA